MSARESAWLAWYMCAVTLMMTALGLLFLIASLSRTGAPVFDYWLLNTVIAVSFSPVSAIIAPRLPPKSHRLAILCNWPLRGRAPLHRRVRHRHVAGGAWLLAERVAWWRGDCLGLFLGVGDTFRAFHFPCAALPRR